MSERSVSEPLPNPLPDDPKKREEIAFALSQMDQQAVSERGQGNQEIDLGTPPQEVLQELGGLDSAADIVGSEQARDWQRQAVAGPSAEQAAADPDQERDIADMNTVMGRDAEAKRAEIRDMMVAGASAELVLDELGGYEAAVRMVGEAEAQRLQDQANAEIAQDNPTTENKENN